MPRFRAITKIEIKFIAPIRSHDTLL